MKFYSFILPFVIGAFFVWGVQFVKTVGEDTGTTIVNDPLPIEQND